MPDIYGAHFEYNGEYSRKYNLIIANENTERNRAFMGATDSLSVYNKKGKRRHIVEQTYANFPLSFEVDIITDNDSVLNAYDIRRIYKWLFNRSAYGKFYVDIADDPMNETTELIDGETKRLYLNCRFINPEKIEYYDGVVGFTATMELDSGCWWQEAIIKQFQFNNTTASSENTFSIVVDSDIDDYIYPKVTINVGSNGGNISLLNRSDSNGQTRFVGVTATSLITLDSESNYVTSLYVENFERQRFPRLIDGENTFMVRGDVSSVTVEYANRRAW